MKVRTSKKELTDITKAWVAISIAFGIVLSKGNLVEGTFFKTFILSALTVGIGFLFHELSHKVLAQRYGCRAEFRSFDNMLVLAIAMSFFGFVFAAPGAVMIQSYRINKSRNGRISVAGPATNLVLAAIFFILLQLNVTGFLATISKFGFLINTWLALFNMIPVWNFDGKKVFKWNKKVYFTVVFIAVIFMML